MIKYIILLVITCIAILGFFGYRYINNLRTEVENLNAVNAELSSALNTSNSTIKELQNSYIQISNISKDLQHDINEREKSLQELSDKLEKLEKTSVKHPKLTEKIVNKATLKSLKCFEDIAKDKECQ